ncbi:hypothetical protein LY13_003776 [Prauserella aidingensis]|nr:hypothetical protein [Prauserella aidingensis]
MLQIPGPVLRIPEAVLRIPGTVLQFPEAVLRIRGIVLQFPGRLPCPGSTRRRTETAA